MSFQRFTPAIANANECERKKITGLNFSRCHKRINTNIFWLSCVSFVVLYPKKQKKIRKNSFHSWTTGVYVSCADWFNFDRTAEE